MEHIEAGLSDTHLGDVGQSRPPTIDPSLGVTMPTSRELELARKVLELERANAELSGRAHVGSSTITIPEALIPLLSQLRTHIASLTADNKALNLLLHSGVKQPEWPEHSINLQLVLDRVKKLTRENDELAVQVLEAGRVSGDELEQVLQDYKSTVLDLEKELEDERSKLNATQSELAAYKAKFGPLNVQPPPQNQRLQRSQSNRNADPNRGRRKPKA